ncbi:MAG: recombinase family protein, partial [Clostridium sp.]|nr:recombinase family protein [Clostridium sp.]
MDSQDKKCFKTAIYTRISRDDEDAGTIVKSESDSIYSQKELIESFVRRRSEFIVERIYADDGYSGTSFERPGFIKMMEDIYNGLIECVIVKDLSRFGRDYIEVGRYIQKIFPSLGIRFVAVTDCYDSLNDHMNETSLMIPVKNFINDAYCRDISEKVRSQQKMKREKGFFIGSFAPYGYMRDSVNHHLLVPDPYAARVVRWIFRLKLLGMGISSIAKQLNEAGILSPYGYKQIQGEKYQTPFADGGSATWSAVAVERILRNEVYVGMMVQGKVEKVNYKVKNFVKKPAHTWVRVEGTHQAVVSQDDFLLVSRLLHSGTRKIKGGSFSHELAGLVSCADCHSSMVRRGDANGDLSRAYFVCGQYHQGQGCMRHGHQEQSVREILIQVLRLFCLGSHTNNMHKQDNIAAINRDRELFEQKEAWQKLHEECMRKVDRVRKRLCNLRDGLWEDQIKGILSKDEFICLYEIYHMQQQKLGKVIEKQGQLPMINEAVDTQVQNRL